ncbi:MAG: hypothetical protein LC115_04745, partial [Bacteroidia bacterium]|nr:hypothetical protein [Bacteroidia bacterium]
FGRSVDVCTVGRSGLPVTSDQLAEVAAFTDKFQSKNELSIYRKCSIEALYPPLRQTGCYHQFFISPQT